MKDKLQAQNLDAYVSSYGRKDSKVRFNVRFGYFEDKKSANRALKNYRNIQKGDGYIVNFSDKNIVSSEEDNIKQTAAEVAPVIKPVDVNGRAGSETGKVQTPDVPAKTQEKGLVN